MSAAEPWDDQKRWEVRFIIESGAESMGQVELALDNLCEDNEWLLSVVSVSGPEMNKYGARVEQPEPTNGITGFSIPKYYPPKWFNKVKCALGFHFWSTQIQVGSGGVFMRSIDYCMFMGCKKHFPEGMLS